jgi:zinc transporter 1/2/3
MSIASLIARQDAGAAFDPQNVDLDTADPRDVVCYLNAGENEYDGRLGARISAIFVILIVSSAVTFFPVLATRSKRVRIPLYVYLFARYFGTGVIVATAFIQWVLSPPTESVMTTQLTYRSLLDPAYEEIGPASCVGMTSGWAGYTWPPAIALASGMGVFLMDFAAERFVEKKYGWSHGGGHDEEKHVTAFDAANARYTSSNGCSNHQALHSGEQDGTLNVSDATQTTTGNTAFAEAKSGHHADENSSIETEDSLATERSFQQQIAAFLILEFGVIFHSVIIGLTLGSVGDEFPVLYPVIVFHQSFEGLGIGARLSAIPFPKRFSWMPWTLCAAYGLTTPIALAIGLGVRTTYNEASMTASIVSGVLDSVSAGILIYTGFVELLARDFLFNPDRTRNDRQLAFMVVSVLLGAGIMALLGKWA